jgi:3-oxoacyl-[acyl-carrier-protein] synthase II
MAKDKMILLESDLHGSEKCVYSDAIDSIRKKTIVGQASAFLVLERASHALQRKARIYATLTDYSTCTDQLCNKIILEHHPDDYERSLQTLFERNGILPSAIDLFVGRSCLPWEIKNTELNVLYKLLQRESRLPIYTTAKCKMGETYGSSGELAAMYGALSLFYNFVPGTGFPESLFTWTNDRILVPERSLQQNDLEKVIASCGYIGGNLSSMLLEK